MSADTESSIGKRMREALRLVRDGAAAEPAEMDVAIVSAHRHLAAASGEFGEVALSIATNRITVQDEVVYKSEARDNNLAFDLFRQGLRKITFRSGVSVDEVGAFIRSLAQTRDVSASDIDFVGTLWQEELEHIQYVAIDGFTEKLFMSEERFTKLFRGVIDDVVPGLLEFEEDDVGDKRRRSYAPADDFDATERAERADSMGLGLVQPIAGRLTTILQAGLGVTALDHLARLLASVCVKDPQPLSNEQLGDILTRLIDAYAEIGEWEGFATCARSFWQLFSSAASFRPPVAARLEALKPAVAGGPLLTAFVARIDEVPRDALAWLKWFLVDCQVLAAPDLLNLMKTSESAAATAYVKDLLHRQGTASLGPWAARLKDPNPVVVLEVLDVILHSPLAPQARPLLLECLKHDEPSIRARAIEGLGIRYDLAVREAILPFLKDSDPTVRRNVVRLVRQANDRSVAPYLAQLIKSNMFGGFEEDEQRQHFEALARLGGARFFKVFEAKLRLEGDGNALSRLFRRGDVTLTDDPIRRGALSGLALLGTPESVALIREVHSRSDLTLAGHCDVVLRLAARGGDVEDDAGPIAAAPPPPEDLSRSAGLLGEGVLFQPAEVLVAPPSRPRPAGAPAGAATPTPTAPVTRAAPAVDNRPLSERPLLGAHEAFEPEDHRQLTATPAMSESGRFRLTSPRAAIIGVVAEAPAEPVRVVAPAPAVEPPPAPAAQPRPGPERSLLPPKATPRPVEPSLPPRPRRTPPSRPATHRPVQPSQPAPILGPPSASPAPAASLDDLLRGYLTETAPAAEPPPRPPRRPAPPPQHAAPPPFPSAPPRAAAPPRQAPRRTPAGTRPRSVPPLAHGIGMPTPVNRRSTPPPQPSTPKPSDDRLPPRAEKTQDVDALLQDFLDFDLGD